jgi:anti-sigma regulatory factor (Ser/Thr protein kinase)
MAEDLAVPTGDAIAYSDAAHLALVRAFVYERARALGLPAERADLLTIAVSELATNTLQHTDDGGRVRVWADAGKITCDVVDRGPSRAFGRPMPPAEAERGRGLAIVERLCDEVTTQSSSDGTVVRLRFAL